MRTFLLAAMVATTLLDGGKTVRAQGSGSPLPSVSVPSPSASATPEAVRRRAVEKAMIERRQREQAVIQQEAQRRIEQLPPEEREAFKRNLRVWRELSPEEREAMRKDADGRMRTEIESALQASGLHLDKDQREVFTLRYRQERRRMERELQEKFDAERARRLQAILEVLKREFAEKAAGSTPSVSVPPPKPVPSVSLPTPKSTPSVSVPAASPR